MSFDSSRFTFDPWTDFSGVVMQQGRVQMDSDWNEWLAEFVRRTQAGTLDILGQATVPSTTPYAFKVTASEPSATGPIDIKIGAGRMYVDGILVENHGAYSSAQWDPSLEELSNTAPGTAEVDLDYTNQPYYPLPTALPAPTQTGSYLVYLDAWQRDIPYPEFSIQYPGLVDPAVGVDTTGRRQTVWQVKFMGPLAANGSSAVNCSTPDQDVNLLKAPASGPAGWSALTQPSGAQLTTGLVTTGAQPGPCCLTPSTGYTGMENQLYRVEIHQGGTSNSSGTPATPSATFKWSRENASVATAVTAIDSSLMILTVVSTGKDSVLGFNPGDWIEITDDSLELNGQSGELHQIAANGVDPTGKTLTLKTAVSGGFGTRLSGGAPAGPYGAQANPTNTYNIRVRRWDQGGTVYESDGKTVWVDLDTAGRGDIPVPPQGTSLILENGITVSFNLNAASDQFKAEDYWNFAARTADGSVESLVKAPPKGVHHHYARLSVVTLSSGTTPISATDCRNTWPSESEEGCACTVCVTAASHANGIMTIQQAVTQVISAGGGTVCLGAGLYQLPSGGVTIANGNSVHIEGQGWRTVLLTPDTAFAVQASQDIFLEEFSVISQGNSQVPAVSLSKGCVGVRLENLILLDEGILTGASLSSGAAAGTPAASAGGPSASSTTTTTAPSSSTVSAIGLSGIVANLQVRNNILMAPIGLASVGTGLTDTGYLMTLELEVADNLFVCQNQAVVLSGISLHGGRTRLGGNTVIDCPNGAFTATGTMLTDSMFEISTNNFLVSGAAVTAGLDARVTGNQLALYGTGTSDGIVVSAGLDPGGPAECIITGNQISGLNGTAVSLGAPMQTAVVSGNTIENCGGGIVFENNGSATWAAIQDNRLYQISLNANVAGDGQAAIGILNVGDLRVTGNWVSGVSVQDTQGALRAGIQLVSCQNNIIRDNQVMDIGPQGNFTGEAVGIDIRSPFDRLDILGNQVRRDSEGTQTVSNSQWWALRVEPLQTLTYVAPKLQVFQLTDGNTVLFTAGGSFVAPVSTQSVVVDGNRLEARGGAPAAFINTTGDCQFRDNNCLLAEPPAVVAPPANLPIINYKYIPLRPLVLNSTVVSNVATTTPAISALHMTEVAAPVEKLSVDTKAAVVPAAPAAPAVPAKTTMINNTAVDANLIANLPKTNAVAGTTGTPAASTPPAAAAPAVDLDVAVQLQAGAIVASGNRVSVSGNATSMLLSVNPTNMVVIGNLTNTAIVAGANLTPSNVTSANALVAPWASLNVNG